MLLCLQLVAPPPVAAAPGHRAIRQAPMNQLWWRKRHRQLNKIPGRRRARLIFVGDSITQHWQDEGRAVWRKHYSRYRALNLGVSGDCTENVLWRLRHGNIEDLSPRVGVLLIGTNNLYRDTPRQIADGIGAIVRLLRRRLPRTRLLLLGILPRGSRTGRAREKLVEVNRIISALADKKRIHYLDIGRRFVDKSGEIPEHVMPDYLHLSQEGYRRWAEAMAPTIRRLLSGR
jgi:beta-glucosidase